MPNPTLLTLAQEFFGERALSVPLAVFSSTDPQVIQLRRLLERGLEDMAGRGRWQELTVEKAHVTLAAESQGDIRTLCDGYSYMLPYTLWDRTNKLPLVGPMAPADWAALKAWVITGPRYQFRLRQNLLLVTPAPAAGYDWRWEYVSNFAIQATAAGALKDRFTADDDEILIPKKVTLADLSWRWKKEKGISYAEDFNTAERMIVDALGRSGGSKEDLHLDQPIFQDAHPGIGVPLMTNITR